MTNTGHPTTPTAPQPERQDNYFIFLGLRELLVGTGMLTVIEYVVGNSLVSTLPLQSMFLIMSAFTVLEIIVFLLIYWAVEYGKGWPALIINSVILLLWAYLIGLAFPSLNESLWYYGTFPKWLLNIINSEFWAGLVYCVFRMALNIGVIFGWFTVLGSALLLAHLYTKQNKAIEKWLKAL